jgi:hypothetical protein
VSGFPEGVERELQSLLELVGAQISADDHGWVEHFLEHHEPGIALLGIADALVGSGHAQSPAVIKTIEDLARRMQVSDELPDLASITRPQ